MWNYFVLKKFKGKTFFVYKSKHNEDKMSLKDLAVELFCQFDEDNKGYITQDQLLNGSCKDGLFAEFSEVQILSIFELLDKENKGVITLTDFTDAFVTDTNETSREDTEEDYYHQNECDGGLRESYSPLLLGGEEEIYARSPSPRVYGSMDSLPTYCHHDEDRIMVKPRSMSCQSEDDLWWNGDDHNQKNRHHNKDFSSSPPSPCSPTGYSSGMRKRTDSLPSIMDPLILKKTMRNNLLRNAKKKWVSVDQGIDRSNTLLYPALMNGYTMSTNHLGLEKNNNLRNTKLNGMTKSDSRIDKILVPLKKLSNDLSNSRNELRLSTSSVTGLNGVHHENHNSSTSTTTATTLDPFMRKHRRQGNAKTAFFGSKDSVLSSIRCNSCTSLRSMDGGSNNKYYDSSNEDLSSIVPRRNRSHSNLLRVQKKPLYMKQQSYDQLCSDDPDCSDESGFGGGGNKHNGYRSRDSLLSNQNGGFYISCENVSSPAADVSIENWESFLRKIGGVSLFAG